MLPPNTKGHVKNEWKDVSLYPFHQVLTCELPSQSLCRRHILFSLSLSWPWSRPWMSQLTKLITNWILSRARGNFSSQTALWGEKKLIYTAPAGNFCAIKLYALFWRKAFRNLRSVNQIKLDSCMKDLYIDKRQTIELAAVQQTSIVFSYILILRWDPAHSDWQPRLSSRLDK